MEVLGQGLVLMLSGMGIVYIFLSILIVVTKFSMEGIGHFDSILPQDAPPEEAGRRLVRGGRRRRCARDRRRAEGLSSLVVG